jgi:hypothetical protein
MEIKKLLIQLIFVFGLIFVLTFIIIFLYNFLMSGVISLQWRMPLIFSSIITVSYFIKYFTEKKKEKDDNDSHI